VYLIVNSYIYITYFS